MHITELDPEKYPHMGWVHHPAPTSGEAEHYFFAFNDLMVVHIFMQDQGEQIQPMGCIDGRESAEQGSLHEAVAIAASQLLRMQLFSRLEEQIKTVQNTVEYLRKQETEATSRSQPGAVGCELSYALVKLREAGHWVRDAIAKRCC